MLTALIVCESQELVHVSKKDQRSGWEKTTISVLICQPLQLIFNVCFILEIEEPVVGDVGARIYIGKLSHKTNRMVASHTSVWNEFAFLYLTFSFIVSLLCRLYLFVVMNKQLFEHLVIWVTLRFNPYHFKLKCFKRRKVQTFIPHTDFISQYIILDLNNFFRTFGCFCE